MAVLADTQALINDALFRAGEIPGSSEWDTKAVDYINREHRALCSGAHEFLPEYINDWWWMRARGVLTLLPVYNTGAVSVVQDSSSIVFAPAPAISLAGRRFKVTDQGTQYQIATHIAGSVNATLDSPYTGPTAIGTAFRAMQMEYSLDTAVQALLSPVASFVDNPQIMGLTPERMDTLFPIGRTTSGIPMAFCLETEQLIRFSHGGKTDGVSMRMEYNYRPSVIDLINNTSSIPLVPLQYRHVLADMTLVYIMFDKNDDRATAVGTSARSTLGAMAKENTRRMVKMDNYVAKIMPRYNNRRQNFNNVLRTESGLIIG